MRQSFFTAPLLFAVLMKYAMYPISDTFLLAAQENTRTYYWVGRITIMFGAVYEFGKENPYISITLFL